MLLWAMPLVSPRSPARGALGLRGGAEPSCGAALGSVALEVADASPTSFPSPCSLCDFACRSLCQGTRQPVTSGP